MISASYTLQISVYLREMFQSCMKSINPEEWRPIASTESISLSDWSQASTVSPRLTNPETWNQSRSTEMFWGTPWTDWIHFSRSCLIKCREFWVSQDRVMSPLNQDFARNRCTKFSRRTVGGPPKWLSQQIVNLFRVLICTLLGILSRVNFNASQFGCLLVECLCHARWFIGMNTLMWMRIESSLK